MNQRLSASSCTRPRRPWRAVAVVALCLMPVTAPAQMVLKWAVGGHTKEINAVTFSSDSALLASASDDNTIKFFNVSNGALVRTLDGPKGSIQSVAFSPDGTVLISGSNHEVNSEGENTPTLQLWRVSDGTRLINVDRGTSSVRSVSFSPKGSLFASGSDDGWVRLWLMPYGDFVRAFPHSNNIVRAVAFSSDGTLLASAGDDLRVRVWKPTDGTLLRTLFGHTLPIRAVAFSPTANLLASASEDRLIRLWNPTTGALIRTLSGHEDRVRSLAFFPDGTRLVSGSWDNTIRIWSVATGTLLRLILDTSDVRSVAVSSNAAFIAWANDDMAVRLWNPSNGLPVRTFTAHRADVLATAFSPDTRLLVSGGDDLVVRLWDVADHRLVRALTGHVARVTALAFTPDGSNVISGGADSALKVWRTADGMLLRTLSNGLAVSSFVFSPQSNVLAALGGVDVIRVWNYATGSLLRTWASDFPLQSLLFVTNGTHLVGAGPVGIHLWRVADGQLLQSRTNEVPQAVVLSPDGVNAAYPGYPSVSDFLIKRWRTGQIVSQTLALTDTAVFSADGRLVATGTPAAIPRRIDLWRVSDGLFLGSHFADLPEEATQGWSFSRDGNLFAYGRIDAALVVLYAPLLISEIKRLGSQHVVQWQGGPAPYQLQRSTEAAPDLWQDVGGPTTQTSATNTATGATTLYRVLGANPGP